MLVQYTRGKTQENVRNARKANVLEQYRKLYYHGMGVSQQALFLSKGKVWKTQEVKHAREYDAAVKAWEESRDFLVKHADYTMQEEDQQYALISMCPAELKKEVLREFSKEMPNGKPQFPTYLSLKQYITNLISRDHDINSGSKGVNGVSGKASRKEDESQEQSQADSGGQAQAPAQEEEWQWYPNWYPDIQNPEEVQQYVIEVNALKGAGKQGKGWSQKKGKGKGKDRKGKGKGKGIGGWMRHMQRSGLLEE